MLTNQFGFNYKTSFDAFSIPRQWTTKEIGMYNPKSCENPFKIQLMRFLRDDWIGYTI